MTREQAADALWQVARRLADGAGYAPTHCPSCDAATDPGFGRDVQPHAETCELWTALMAMRAVDWRQP